MNNLRDKAIEFRKKGYSYNEINQLLNIPKSTLSNWLSKIDLSLKARTRLDKRKTLGTLALISRNKQQTKIAISRARKIQLDASKLIGNLTNEKILLVASALYWAEGYKKPRFKNGKAVTSHAISFVNSDPDMIRLFILFLKKIMKIPESKIVVCMRLYPNIDENKCKKYWLKVTGLKVDNFRKTTYLVSISSKRKKPFNRLPHGTLSIQVFDTKRFHNIMGFINGLKYAINNSG